MRSRVPGRRIDQLETGTLRWTSGRLVSWLISSFSSQRNRHPGETPKILSTNREKTMRCNRRDFLKAGIAFSAATAIPSAVYPESVLAPQPGSWRTFRVTTKLDIRQPSGSTKAWIPLPSVNEKDWFRTIGSQWNTNGRAEKLQEQRYGAEMLYVQWRDGENTPAVEVTSTVAVRDRFIDLSSPSRASELSAAERNLYLSGAELIPVDGIVKETSDKITAGQQTDLGRARAIYEWVVENTFRDGATRGCGAGDIAAMLRTGYLGGKCADLNALFVGLSRAAGIPARDIYGIRVAPSNFGYKSLGAASPTVTKAQHCRAEVFLEGFGWVPADPADVRKVALEEPPTHLSMDDAKVVAARRALFGSWETNWLAYNFAHDVELPGSQGQKLAFLMYPQAETAAGRVDCLDADNFTYTIVANEVTA